MNNKYFDEIKECLNDFKDGKTIYKQIPNLLTLFRIIGIIPINILYFTNNIIGTIVVSAIVFLTDFFDGIIARKYHIESNIGAKLDAVSDKVLAIGLSIPLAFNIPFVLLNLLLELFISMINIITEKHNYNPKSNMIGKIKTWFLSITLASGYLSLLINLSNYLLPLLIVITSITQTLALSKYINHYQKEKRNDQLSIEGVNYQNNLKDINIQNIQSHDIELKIAYLKKEKEQLLIFNYMMNEKRKVKVKIK